MILVALVAIGLWLAVCLISVRHPGRAPWPPAKGSPFTAAWAWGVTLLLYVGIVRLGLDHMPDSPLRWAVGGGLSVAGSVLQGVGVAQLGLARTSGWDTARPVTTGLYARLRHPQYVGQALFFAGWAVLTLHLPTVALCLAAIGLLGLVGWTESHVHRVRDGAEWRRYLERTPG